MMTRLIDANALQRVFLPIASTLEHEYGSLGGAVSGVIRYIDSAPTIYAVPVSELEKLRDYLYSEDLISMRGLAELNKLIANCCQAIDWEVSE